MISNRNCKQKLGVNPYLTKFYKMKKTNLHKLKKTNLKTFDLISGQQNYSTSKQKTQACVKTTFIKNGVNKHKSKKQLSRKWAMRWRNKYVALKINFQHNRVQANLIDSFPATIIQYYLRRAKLDTHGHIARKRLQASRESFFIFTKILEDLKLSLSGEEREGARPVSEPILGRIFFKGWNIRLKLRKVIRHIKTTYKYNKRTTFTQVSYRSFSRMFSPRRGRRRNRRKKLRSVRKIRHIRQKKLWRIKAIRKFVKRYVTAVCTVRPLQSTDRGSVEWLIPSRIGQGSTRTMGHLNLGFRKLMSTQLKNLTRRGYFSRVTDWNQCIYYKALFSPKEKTAFSYQESRKRRNQLRLKKRQMWQLRQLKKQLRGIKTEKKFPWKKRKKKLQRGYYIQQLVVPSCNWLLHAAHQRMNTGRYAKQLTTITWKNLLIETYQQ